MAIVLNQDVCVFGVEYRAGDRIDNQVDSGALESILRNGWAVEQTEEEPDSKTASKKRKE